MSSPIEIRNDKFQRIVAKIEALEQETMRDGFPIAARALNNAKNALGWEVSGALELAALAAKGGTQRMKPELSPEEQFSRDAEAWRAHCLGGPLLWQMSAAGFAVMVFYYVVATWGSHQW